MMKTLKKVLPITVIFAVLAVGFFLCPAVLAEGIEDLPTGENVKTWIVQLAGNLLIVVLIVFAVKNFISQQWGAMIATLLGGAFVAWIIWFTDSFTAFLKAIVTAFGG